MMSNANRVAAIEKIAAFKEGYSDGETPFPPEEFGKYVFNESVIKRYLPKESAQKLLATIRERKPLDVTIADDVANAMKEWAVSLGATHYTHWFQPLNGGTAEKHDAFLELSETGEPLKLFSGKNLIKGEPDASSFPSGGLRCTFEARGYTAWDPTSPAFVKRHRNGTTLCIPTIFCSFTGQILDKKTPLLRSIRALETAVKRLTAVFGLPDQPVKVSLGAEQEYFLIDRNFYLNRPDLVQTGRTLFGAAPPRNRQLVDHYFGSIRPEILAFMTDVDHELWRLGIPAKTRHNESAPAQFEVAPIFEELNLAVDHNMLLMDILKRTALRHGMVCLLHEKPFAGVNGSGKHNNWSVTCGGRNLLDPGDNPEQNALFLTVLAAIIRAVDLHSDILRVTTVSAGNKHRLGMGEAPPVIISVFLGEQLTAILDRLGSSESVPSPHADEMMRIGVDTLPALPKDTADRNRTSPFAFTGNKFEFRACGSSQSCAGFNTVLNTIIAESLDMITDRLETLDRSDKDAFHTGLTGVIAGIIRKHRRIIFNGNNYSPEWVAEAEKRGLPNVRKSIEALRAYLKPENQELFTRYNVFSKAELESRFEVFSGEYHSKVRIEGGVALEIARTMVLPIVMSACQTTLDTLLKIRESGISAGIEGVEKMAETYGTLLDRLVAGCEEMKNALGGEHEGIIDNMRKLREIVDHAEEILDDSLWPLPKYREMLFVYN